MKKENDNLYLYLIALVILGGAVIYIYLNWFNEDGSIKRKEKKKQIEAGNSVEIYEKKENQI